MIGGSAGRFNSSTIPIRLRSVCGYQNRTNDIIYCPPLIKHDDESTAVVYFGGDVQDFTENMEINRDSKSYMKYNLESTALLLRNGFPKSHIIIIRPARMEFKTFSCFDNFVRSNNAGVPDHTPMHYALLHMEKLLLSTSQKLMNLSPVVSATPTTPPPPNSNNTTPSAVATTATVAATGAAATTTAAAVAPSVSTEQNAQMDIAQDMDIDILQVQETVTVDTDGAIVFPCKDQTTNSMSVLPSDLPSDLLQNDHSSSNLNSTPGTSEISDLLFDPTFWRDKLNLDKCKLTLIGFSKGCVVLNQFIYEFHYLKTLTPDDSSMFRLLSRIKEIYWLDGGHGGSKNTWITSRSLLETLTRLNINIHIHVTPYQVQDDRRPWIRKEEKTFTELLRRLGAPLTRCLHFDTAVASLYTHFDVLQVFWQPCPPQPPVHIKQPKDGEDEK